MRRIAFACFIVLSSGWNAFSQQSPVDAVIQFLNFSDAQAATFRASLIELQTTVAGIQPQIEAKQRQLNALLAAESPSDVAVGRVVVELNGLQGQIGRAADRYHEKFRNMLLPEQMERVMAVLQARELLPAVMAFAAVQIIAPPATPQN